MPRKKTSSAPVSSNSPVSVHIVAQAQTQSSVSLGVPVQVYNLGSPDGARMDFGRDEIWRRMNKRMGQKALRIPVFLVNEPQMDSICPPKYFKPVITKEDIGDALEKSNQKDKIENIEKLLKNEEDKTYKDTVAVGLYVRDYGSHKTSLPQLGDSNFCTPNANAAFQSQNGPAIFLCCERIVKWASRLSVSFHLVMDKVYYHELGHAVMDTSLQGTLGSPYYNTWGRVVEESFANSIAYDCFSGGEALWVQRMIQDQPPEYRGYLAADEKLVFEDTLDKYGYYIYREIFGVRRRLPWENFPVTNCRTLNIEYWKQFKETSNNTREAEEWKTFALAYLYVEGLKE